MQQIKYDETEQQNSYSEFLEMSMLVYKKTGIKPTDFETVIEYTQAVLSKVKPN